MWSWDRQYAEPGKPGMPDSRTPRTENGTTLSQVKVEPFSRGMREVTTKTHADASPVRVSSRMECGYVLICKTRRRGDGGRH